MNSRAPYIIALMAAASGGAVIGGLIMAVITVAILRYF
jgi:hypothetical protein